MVICYKDRTYCASPNCKNECGRQYTDAIKDAANREGMLVSLAYFCGEPCEHDMNVFTDTCTKCGEMYVE